MGCNPLPEPVGGGQGAYERHPRDGAPPARNGQDGGGGGGGDESRPKGRAQRHEKAACPPAKRPLLGVAEGEVGRAPSLPPKDGGRWRRPAAGRGFVKARAARSVATQPAQAPPKGP